MDFSLTDAQRALQQDLRAFAAREVAPTAAARDEDERFDPTIFRAIGAAGFAGLPFPGQYGGAGGDAVSSALATEELSRVCAATGIMLSTHVSLVAWPVFRFGTDEQKRAFLAPLASGEKLGAYGLSEPDSGGDDAGIQTTAVRRGDDYLLQGAKVFSINGGEADIYVVYAATDPTQRSRGMTAFILEKGMPGLRFGKTERKMGVRSAVAAELVFEDCVVPAANRLGAEGEGLKIALAALDGGRTGIAALAVGIAQGALEEALAHARGRTHFNRPLLDFQTTQFKLADMQTEIEAARLLTRRAAWLEARAAPYTRASAMAKVMASDVAMRVTTEAVQILGGYGYMRDRPVERMMRDAKITQIYGGTNEVQRMVIARHVLAE